MTKLNSKFDIIGRDPHPNARVGLLVVLPVYQGSQVWIDPETGTPVAGTIKAGTIVAMNSAGEAVVASSSGSNPLMGDFPSLLFTTIDGDTDFDGAYVHRITCIQGGAEFQLSLTDNVDGTTGYVVGTPLSVGTGGTAGKWIVATSNKQIYGFVGPDGINVAKGTLNVIVPQGLSPKLP